MIKKDDCNSPSPLCLKFTLVPFEEHKEKQQSNNFLASGFSLEKRIISEQIIKVFPFIYIHSTNQHLLLLQQEENNFLLLLLPEAIIEFLERCCYKIWGKKKSFLTWLSLRENNNSSIVRHLFLLMKNCKRKSNQCKK